MQVFSARATSVGPTRIFVSDAALRMEFGDDKTYLVACAPTWRVVLFNSTSGKGMAMGYPQWLSHKTSWSFGYDDSFLDEQALLKVGTVRVQGLVCSRYKLARKLASGKIVPKISGVPGEYVVYENPRLPIEAAKIVRKALNLPILVALPVSMTLFEKHGENVHVEGYSRRMGGVSHLFELIKYEQLPFDKKLFVYPTQFKSTRKEAEVFMDTGRTKQVEQFLDYMQ